MFYEKKKLTLAFYSTHESRIKTFLETQFNPSPCNTRAVALLRWTRDSCGDKNWSFFFHVISTLTYHGLYL